MSISMTKWTIYLNTTQCIRLDFNDTVKYFKQTLVGIRRIFFKLHLKGPKPFSCGGLTAMLKPPDAVTVIPMKSRCVSHTAECCVSLW